MNSTNLKDKINNLAQTEVLNKEPSFNLIIVNTPFGQMKVKTHLSKEKWIAEQELRLKNKPKKTKKRK